MRTAVLGAEGESQSETGKESHPGSHLMGPGREVSPGAR